MSKDEYTKKRIPRGPNVRIDSIKEKEELDEIVQPATKMPSVSQTVSKDLVQRDYFQGDYTQDIDHYVKDSEIVLTEEDKKVITTGMRRKATGLMAAVPLKCVGDKCPFKHECPFYKIGKAPVGHPCPVEGMVMDLYTKRYLDEYGVVTDTFSETTTMTMLAATHVMEMRAWRVLGEEENQSGIIENVVGFNENEEPIVQRQEHPAFNIIERAWRWRDKLLVSLVGTRREKYKREAALKEKAGDNSLSKRAADLKAKIDQMAAVETG
jgi:hypothetical protein